MPQIDVKITDLQQVSALRNDDLFLIAHPMIAVTGGSIENYPYTSNSISGAALSSTIRETLRKQDLIIEGHWHFHGGDSKIPTQDTKLEIDDFISALEDDSKLSSIINDIHSGWYRDLSSSKIQLSNEGDTQSISVINNGIPNIDFVERAIAGAYQSLLNQLTTIISPSGDSHFIPTHVGEIVYSTRFSKADYSENGNTAAGFNLNNPSQATNIRQFYGYGQKINGVQYPNTKWILHSGYFLRGANSSQPNNNNKNSSTFNGGGQDSKDYSVPLKKHTHSITNTSGGTSGSVSGSIGGSTNPVTFNGTKNSNTANNHQGHNKGMSFGPYPITITHTVSGSCSIDVSSFNSNIRADTTGDSDNPIITVNHLPKYKNVYIWERIE